MEAKMFDDHDAVAKFIMAGKAVVTLTSQKTGAHLTYRVSQAKSDNGKLQNRWFVAVLSGPDNENDFTYIGMLDDEIGLRRTKGSRFGDDSPSVAGFRYFWQHICAGHLPPHMEVRHDGRCGRCHRPLTVPESIDRGIGPECWGKVA